MISRRALLTAGAASLLLPGIGKAASYLPPGLPLVDLSNPLAYGLTGVYVPGRGAKKIYDLLGKGATLNCGGSQAFKPTQEGFALDTSAQGAGGGCNGVATSVQQPAKNASLFWRGVLLGTPLSNEYVFGVEFGDGNTSPFDAFDLVYMGTGVLQGSASQTTPVGTNAVTWAAPTLVPVDATVTVDMTVGALNIYGNGALAGTSGIATPNNIDYGTNPQMEMGSTTSASQNASNTRHLVGYTWNRTLSATEAMSLHMDPYQLLIFPNTQKR